MKTDSSAARRPASACGLRIHTHGEVTPEWALQHAVPVWRTARAGGLHLVTLRRGWLGGPHVEVGGLDSDDGIDWRRLAQAVDAGPAPSRALDGGAYLRRARERGRLENVPPPYLPLRRHGEVVLVRSGRDDEPLGSVRAVLAATLAPAVVATLEDVVAEPGVRSARLTGVLTAVAASHPLGAGFGAFSLRSHVEAMLAWLAPRTDMRAEFARRLEPQRAAVTAEVRRTLDWAAPASVLQWSTAIAYARGVVDENVRAGRISDEVVDDLGRRAEGQEGPPGAAAMGPVGEHPETDFHRSVYGSGATGLAGEWFAGYRVLVNAVYAQLPLLGVSALQRSFGCYAVAEAIDEVLGQSWTNRLAVAAELAAGPVTSAVAG